MLWSHLVSYVILELSFCNFMSTANESFQPMIDQDDEIASRQNLYVHSKNLTGL